MPRESRTPLGAFDPQRLPVGARTPGTPAFSQAVVQHITQDCASRGRVALVWVTDVDIRVTEFASVMEALAEGIVPLLTAGQISRALPMLEGLTKGYPADAQVLYNLGIAYSELGQFDEAVIRLKRAVQLDPAMTHAWVGIGTAYQRMGKLDLALPALETALGLSPSDGYAHRNLGAVLGQLGRHAEAAMHLGRAVEAMPEDPKSLYGLALTLGQLAQSTDEEDEADRLMGDFVRRFPEHEQAEAARTSRTQFAQRRLRSAVPSGVRLDVVFYIQGALQRFKEVGPDKRHAIALEIALLGRQGLDINDATEKYQLRSLRGTFSGLHLASLMYTAFRQMDPTLDIGADFSKEYALAEALGGILGSKAGTPPARKA